MSRRKQSKPRQIKRALGELDGGEDNALDDHSLSGEDGGVSDPEDSLEGDNSCSSPPSCTPLYSEEPKTHNSCGAGGGGGVFNNDENDDGDDDRGEEEEDDRGPTLSGEERVEEDEEEEEGVDEEETMSRWTGPDELRFSDEVSDGGVVAVSRLRPHTTWGPYSGVIQSGSSAEEQQELQNSRWTLVCEDPACWIGRLPLTLDLSAANCVIYSHGEQLFCKVTRELAAGGGLVASLLSPPPHPGSAPSSPSQPHPSAPLSLVTQKQPTVKEEPLPYPAALHSDIQLLPQQAGMAAILATAVVNKDIFPCKDCGIWFRSERNLQAHLMYYCASRQKQPASTDSSPPPPPASSSSSSTTSSSSSQDKLKESFYPNERICPFPQCNKSCPSASSLEIHMRTHSGERPFVCLICLSAFTTKANCERHLKVHTDTLQGLCHGCGFVSTTRDILYSHLVTSHMVCQPGSRSEVYSPGPGLPKLPLSTGLSPGDSGVVLKCQVCGHNCDSPSQLQQHVRTHLEVRVPAERSPTPRQVTPSLVDGAQLRLSPHDREPLACVPKPESSSPGANGSSATPRDYSPAGASTTDLKIKEEPQSDSEMAEQPMAMKEDEEEGETAGGDEGKTKEAQNATSSSRASGSPRSPATMTVKAEPTSPTPGSSPAHVGGAESVLPGGAMFLPQYMFNPEAAILPQASEILAKMSEMVHSRLKQGQTVSQNNVAAAAAAAFFPAGPAASTASTTPPHKGARCFECDITFNNINNFYAHKRLYCSSRHQGDGVTSASVPGVPVVTRETTPAVVPSNGARGSSASPQAGAGSRAASASPTDSDGPARESKRVAEVKKEPSVGREGISSSSEGEGGSATLGGAGGGGRTSEGSQSPASGSAEDQEDDPNKTFCEACNIRFSRHDNYTVHKRFYCASRHDPSNHRSVHMAKANTTTAFLPQPIRTRKRKKMYEIHMARTEALAAAAAVAAATAASAAAAPSASVLGLAMKQEVSPGTEGASSPERDGPIDLSKRPRLRDVPRQSGGSSSSSSILPALPLTDYHKCTACSISFNSIENYLAHKTYYCPATTLQPHTLEQLQRLKRSASTSPKSRPQQERPDLLHPVESKVHPAEWICQARGLSSSPHVTKSPPQTSITGTTAAATGAGPGSTQVLCPYCPNKPIVGDLMEHFHTVHSLVVTVEDPQEEPSSAVSHSLSPRDAASAAAGTVSQTTPNSQARPLTRVHRDSVNGQVKSGTASPVSPLVSSTPSPGGRSPSAGSPLPVSPSGAASLTVSPVPEALRETAGSFYLQEKNSAAAAAAAAALANPAPVHGPKATVISPVQNGNSRFCRLCNIKFSSLSTFIAHKKYYCSSHSAEHVK